MGVHPATDGRGLRRRSALVVVLVVLVVLLGALGTGLSAVALHYSAHSLSERAFDQKQGVVATVVTAETAQYAVTLTDVAASVGAQTRLTAAQFGAITAPLNDRRLPGGLAVSYVVTATAATGPSVQADWRRRGSKGLTLHFASGSAGEHYFTVASHALGTIPATVGDEVAAPAGTLRLARSLRTVATSQTYGVPTLWFLMAAPVYATSPPSQAGQFRGWITMSFLCRDFLGGFVQLIAGDQINVALDDLVDGRALPVATWQPAPRLAGSLPARTVAIPAPQRLWRLTMRATVKMVPAREAWLDTLAAGVGSLLTVLLAALTGTVMTARNRALRRVDQATAELRHDIERREAVEQQLRRREEELMGFAGVVAHDLRSPLANVMGHAELLAMAAATTDMPEKQRRHLTQVQGSAARMQHLIDDLLAYAMAENATLRIEAVDLDALVENIIAERGGDGSPAKIERGDLPAVVGDPTLVRQILDNLIGNAIKYTPAGQAPEVCISSVEADDGSCRIEIADRGIGIPDAQRGEIFNAFTRADGSERYPGTGLGLAIVQRIVNRHGGAVGVEENPGGGSRFWFTLTPVGQPASPT